MYVITIVWSLVSSANAVVIRYRFQYDGRLQRSLETGKQTGHGKRKYGRLINVIAVMLMETFDRLSRQDKYVWDVSSLKQEPWNYADAFLCHL